jgi:transposase
MAKTYSDDLRRRILRCWEEGKQTQQEIAERFCVSVRYIGKIVQHKRRTGQAEGIPHRPGRKPKFTPPICERLQSWLKSEPDLTLAELQKKLEQEEGLHSSQFSIWTALRKMGLR